MGNISRETFLEMTKRDMTAAAALPGNTVFPW